MLRKLQISVTEENWSMIEAILKEANENFESGNINYSDVVNEMILNAKIEIKNLRAKNINVRKSLRSMASLKEIDLDLAIKTLTDLKNKGGKRVSKNSAISERPANEN